MPICNVHGRLYSTDGYCTLCDDAEQACINEYMELCGWDDPTAEEIEEDA